MKNQLALLALAAGVASASGAAFAADNGPVLAGSVGAATGVRQCSNSAEDACRTHVVNEYTARVSAPIALGFSAQIDGAHERYTGMYDAGDQARRAQATNLHLSWRNDKFLVGIFAGEGMAKLDDRGDGTLHGLEGQVYLDRVTFYGQFGSANLENEPADDNRFNGRYRELNVRYFPQDDLQLDVVYSFGRSGEFGDTGTTSDWGELTTFGVSAKKRLVEKMPLYGSAKFESTQVVNTDDDNGSESRIVFGLTWEFGTDNLLQADRRGATLSTSLLPSRAMGWAESFD